MISLCVPVMNRLDDLRQVLPALLRAAEASPPIEIAVLDYNSSDGLADYIRYNPSVTYRRYEGRDTYHMAHARNLSVRISRGDYVLISSADIIVKPAFLEAIRREIAQGAVWTHGSERFVGVLCIQRDEFMAAGGFDERFELYGKEDKDLLARLERRGKPHAQVPDALELIYTPWEKKLANYRIRSRNAARRANKPVYEQNMRDGVLVANAGKEWGAWA